MPPSWQTFVPVREGWPASVWFEIDTSAVSGEYVGPKDLSERQDIEGAHRHTLMPRIEAAVIGSIPLRAIRAAYLSSEGGEDFEELQIQR